MRALFALVLSLVLGLGSVSMAIARGQSAGGDSITICIGQGTETILVDARGKPRPNAPHLCPDCLSASSVFMLPDLVSLPAPPTRVQQAEVAIAGHNLANLSAPAALARGPPALSV